MISKELFYNSHCLCSVVHLWGLNVTWTWITTSKKESMTWKSFQGVPQEYVSHARKKFEEIEGGHLMAVPSR